MTNKDIKEYMKAWYQEHREERKSYQKDYYQAHREEQKAQRKSWYKSHMEERKAQMKSWYKSHMEERKAQMKAWYQSHMEERKAQMKAYSKAHRDEQKAYSKSDTNSFGQTKNLIRKKSSSYLFNVLKHNKLKNYEIHHCFGYDDYRNFIYIPKSLHLQIHQFLRDNGISADTNHYDKIVHLIIACEDYVYIKA